MSEKRLRVAVAEDDLNTRKMVCVLLRNLGFEVVLEAVDGRQLVEGATAARPDLVIADVMMPNMDGIDAVIAVNRAAPVPALLVSGYSEENLVRRAAASSNVMGYLLKPIDEADLRTAVLVALARFKQAQELAAEAAALKQTLEDRKIVERGKGVVMKRLGIDEADAYRRLRLYSSTQNRKVSDVCRQIIDADEVFLQAEKIGAEPG